MNHYKLDSPFQEIFINRLDEINDQIAKLEAERDNAMLKEKANVLAKMKSDIKL